MTYIQWHLSRSRWSRSILEKTEGQSTQNNAGTLETFGTQDKNILKNPQNPPKTKQNKQPEHQPYEQ